MQNKTAAGNVRKKLLQATYNLASKGVKRVKPVAPFKPILKKPPATVRYNSPQEQPPAYKGYVGAAGNMIGGGVAYHGLSSGINYLSGENDAIARDRQIAEQQLGLSNLIAEQNHTNLSNNGYQYAEGSGYARSGPGPVRKFQNFMGRMFDRGQPPQGDSAGYDGQGYQGDAAGYDQQYYQGDPAGYYGQDYQGDPAGYDGQDYQGDPYSYNAPGGGGGGGYLNPQNISMLGSLFSALTQRPNNSQIQSSDMSNNYNAYVNPAFRAANAGFTPSKAVEFDWMFKQANGEGSFGTPVSRPTRPSYEELQDAQLKLLEAKKHDDFVKWEKEQQKNEIERIKSSPAGKAIVENVSSQNPNQPPTLDSVTAAAARAKQQHAMHLQANPGSSVDLANFILQTTKNPNSPQSNPAGFIRNAAAARRMKLS